MKKIAILQSNYIPWKGYFDLINSVDEFVIYDTVQYTKNDWRNRNRIKTSQGVQWLTIPVRQKKLSQRIDETEVQAQQWHGKHWKAITQSYSRAAHFKTFRDEFEALYVEKAASLRLLSEINVQFIVAICSLLGIETQITFADSLVSGEKSERLVRICKERRAAAYLSGPSAKGYLDTELFRRNNIAVEWMDYAGYPVYPQLHGEFVHEVSIIDLICNVGKDAQRYMKSFHREK